MFRQLDGWEDGRVNHVYIRAPALQHIHPKAEKEAVYGETNKSHHPIPRTPGECPTTKLRTNQRRVLEVVKQATVAGQLLRAFQRTLPIIS